MRGSNQFRENRAPLVGTVVERYPGTGNDSIRLRVFLAGGGASSAWYKNSIERTLVDRNLHQFGYTACAPSLWANRRVIQGMIIHVSWLP